jgi:hypothetical protein
VTLPPKLRDAFSRDLRAAQEAVAAGVVSDQAAAAERQWDRWAQFCRTLSLDPTLSTLLDPVTILQVYAQRYRTGELAPGGHPVSA